jgi:hypothetical protein
VSSIVAFPTSPHQKQNIGHGSQSIREKVFALIASSGERGRTCDEVEAILQRSHQTVSARVRELVLAERIYDCGERRATRTGWHAVVYRAGSEAPVPPPPKDDDKFYRSIAWLTATKPS